MTAYLVLFGAGPEDVRMVDGIDCTLASDWYNLEASDNNSTSGTE